MENQSKTIYEVLGLIQAKIKVQKTKENTFGGFMYRSAEDILEALKPILFEYNTTVVLYDDVVELGGWHYVKATATLFWKDESLAVRAYAREQESRPKMDASQLTGGASSYARKYALQGLLLLDDGKDADDRDNSNKGKTTKASENKIYVDKLRAYILKSAGQEEMTKIEVANWLGEHGIEINIKQDLSNEEAKNIYYKLLNGK